MKFCTVIRGLKSKIEFVGDKNLITPSLFYPKFLKICITAYRDFKAVNNTVPVRQLCNVYLPPSLGSYGVI